MASITPRPLPTVPPAPTVNVGDGSGKTLGALPLSDQDRAQLAANGKITMTFHTPRMLRETLGPRNFTITLTQDGLGNITGDPNQVAQAVSHLAEISNALALGVVIKEG